MQIHSLSAKALAAALSLLLTATMAFADPPSRVARLGYLQGDVSFGASQDDDWVQASLNRPLSTGDRLWTDRNAGAELQLGGAAIRMGERSNLTVLNLDDSITQLQLAQGAVKLRIRSMAGNQRFEVDTPNLAVTISQPGDYRVEVDPQNDATTVRVQSGQADVDGDGAAYRVAARQGYRFYGTDLSDFEGANNVPADALDQWAQARERRIDESLSARYVAPNVVGYEDLDANGSWRVDASYGNVWIPSRVPLGWTPYRDGQWAWVDPWGWTWVDAAPWGYTVSHYGRWAHIGGSWGWVPGPVREVAVYAPALVVFVGERDLRTPPRRGGSIGVAGWFPLAPREVYRPNYQASRTYFDRVNRSNAVIAPATISTTYNTVINNTTVNKVVYVNQQVHGAVVAPNPQQVRPAAPEAHSRPPQDNHPVVARTAPPPPVKADSPGAPPAKVRVVTAPNSATPAAVPPPPPPRGNARNEPRADVRTDPGRGERKPEAAPARAEPPKADAAANAATNAAANAAQAEANRKNAAAREEANKAEANRVNAERANAERAKADAARADAAKAEAAKSEANRVNAERANAERANAERANAERAKADQAKAARAEPARPPAAPRAEHPEQSREPRNGRPLTPEEELLRKQRGEQKQP